MTDSTLWHVVLPTPLRKPFLYRMPTSLGAPEIGMRVRVPFGRRQVTGYLLAPCPTPPQASFEIKDILELLDDVVPLPEELIRFLKEAASYYMHGLGEVFKTALPPGLDRAVNGTLSTPSPTTQDFLGSPVATVTPPVLNAEQTAAVEAITSQLHNGGYRGFLLHGVTGSGKTEVYFNAIDTARSLGKGALVLVPEISLTPQLIQRYRARFGDGIAVLHSGLSVRNRRTQWQLLRTGQVRVAIGVRSAIFAPVDRLGIIIVDEEHDASFKQESRFTYNARDLTLLRAARAGAVAVLGSATPSLETYYNAEIGKLEKLRLTKRATSQALPEVTAIDLTKHHSGPGGQTLITQPLYTAICETLEREEQAILFLNRRGFAPSILCGGCGEVIRCRSCSVSLTLHRHPPGLICHYCGSRWQVPSKCPACGATDLCPIGTGTQRAETILSDLFSSARIARMDRDSAAGKKGEAILDKLRQREIDILVGTQMVTKGHDFPYVTLVGVLNADVGLHMPDFRASERTFQLLMQVTGRAGRDQRGGRAFIQTYSTPHPAIDLARFHDYQTFVKMELETRRELGYPPFGRLAALRISSKSPEKVQIASQRLAAELREIHRQQSNPGVTILGPAAAPLEKVQNRYRWRIHLRSHRYDLIRRLIEPVLQTIENPPAGVRIRIDIDPQSML
ncbi:MAG: primosomal protein N' [Myxococcota bacterium]|nr:primosomal protein N' [Myxococcota bacterium]